ncbi:MAG: dihydroxyacetone kinase subunit DhaL, partial [Rubrivivax sp.]
MDILLARRIVETLADRIVAHADALTALDQAIGDGDHGLNMKRGFEAVRADLDTLAAGGVAALWSGVGRTLVMKVGGASGPLYGTLFLQLGKSWPASAVVTGTPDAAALARCFEEAVAAVAARGKSQAGQKTMLDVLVPVVARVAAGDGPAALRDHAAAAAEAILDRREAGDRGRLRDPCADEPGRDARGPLPLPRRAQRRHGGHGRRRR